MKHLTAIFCLMFSLLTAPAFAADSIKHFYGDMLVSLTAGIPMDDAVTFAVGNEMIDRGIWTNPMGLPTPRLLFHFLGTPLEFTVNEGGLKRGLAIATVKHPLFYNLLKLGIERRDPVMIGAAKHLLIDTFYHAGYSNLLGHGEGGHRPDMAHEEVQKAQLCFQALIEVDFILRDMMNVTPDFTILKRVVGDLIVNKTYATQLRSATGAQTLEDMVSVISKRPDIFAQVIQDHPLFRNTFFTHMEKSEPYWDIAIREVLQIYKDKGYSQLDENSLHVLADEFSDVSARTDLDPAQSLKIILFRIMQLQDPVLAASAAQDYAELGYTSDRIREVLNKGRFNFAELAGYADNEGLAAQINIETEKNITGLKMLIANLEILARRVEVIENGQAKIQPSHAWSHEVQTMFETTAPNVLSWLRLLNQDGSIRLVEHRDIGALVSSQTDTDWMRNLLDHDPGYLENALWILKKIESNPSQLRVASRLKALAETAYFIAHNSTKDLFPGKLSPIKKVVYEDDKLPHACFASECRKAMARNLIADFANIKVVEEPVGVHKYLLTQVQAALAKLNPNKVMETTNNAVSEYTQVIREFVHGLGMGTKDSNGNIILPEDSPALREIAPNLNFAGYRNWGKFTWDYVYRVMLKVSKAKNAEIQAYIQNGEQMKSDVTKAIYESYFSPAATGKISSAWTTKYGTLQSTPTAKANIIGIGTVPVLRCAYAHSGH